MSWFLPGSEIALSCLGRKFDFTGAGRARTVSLRQVNHHMGNLKKKRRLKMNKHKRRKRLKANRHKKRTWQK